MKYPSVVDGAIAASAPIWQVQPIPTLTLLALALALTLTLTLTLTLKPHPHPHGRCSTGPPLVAQLACSGLGLPLPN